MELAGKVAIVTGGGTGMGKEFSKRLAAAGASVVVNYSRSGDDAAATVGEIEAAGGKAAAVQADVADAGQVERLVAQTLERFGRLDVVVNNAGTTVFVPFSDLSGIDEAAWDRIMAVNVKGPWLLAKAAASALAADGGGAIVTISSVAGLKPGGSSLAYSVSKAAMIQLTKGLAVALAPNVRVNSIAPGFVDTRWHSYASEERKRQMAQALPLRNHVSAESVATAALECLRNDHMTGQVIAIDSGSLL
ncbi:MAG: SDR family NAD(P)-dependent oxidoreductase [Chloroflexi bacterium]|nr:SDR family NAD(P)-dependent oxidoreductase [Chloroflexota bacterium]